MTENGTDTVTRTKVPDGHDVVAAARRRRCRADEGDARVGHPGHQVLLRVEDGRRLGAVRRCTASRCTGVDAGDAGDLAGGLRPPRC